MDVTLLPYHVAAGPVFANFIPMSGSHTSHKLARTRRLRMTLGNRKAERKRESHNLRGRDKHNPHKIFSD